MSRRTVCGLALCLLISTGTLATLAAPQDEDSSGPLPFLQFTKGGIRVNFAGYHAQAGLGGLLTGRTADGGLHASAGTPSGAHASAGLGGSLGDGPSGGLHARAGLGNGGPEAEAGLGGTLAGPRPRGTIFATASPGVGYDRNNVVGRNDAAGKNIQVIPRPKKASEQEAAAIASDLKEASSSSSTSASSSAATVNAGATDGDDAAEDKRSQLPARFYFEKRARERAGAYYNPAPSALRETSPTTTDNAIAAAASAGASAPKDAASPGERGEEGKEGAGASARERPPGLLVRATAGAAAADDDAAAAGVGGGKRRFNKGTLFDDIFNIPISALNAVNQLLRNHVGKK